MEWLDFAIDSIEHTMFIRSIIYYLFIIIMVLVILKLFVSLIKQVINLFRK